MNTLPHARFWHVVGGGLVLIVVVASLVPARSLPHLGMTDKLEHMIAYGGLAVCYGGLMRPRHYGYLGVGLLALGGGIEIAQGLMGMGREADLRDFYADALGGVKKLASAGGSHAAAYVGRVCRPAAIVGARQAPV